MAVWDRTCFVAVLSSRGIIRFMSKATLSMTQTGKHETMSQERKNSTFEIDTGKISMTLPRLFAIMIGAITICVGGVTVAANAATTADVDAIMEKHSKAPHHVQGKAVSAPADIVPIVEGNQRAVATIKASMKDLHTKADKGATQMHKINARLEFLIERELGAAQGDSGARQTIRRAARKVRARAPHLVHAGDYDDPLAGL